MSKTQDQVEREFKHAGRCLHCRAVVGALTAREWAKVVRAACPHCGRAGW